tara:strand:- start:412 stop:528 length:117 start_codon:yes stop_codon:yes gene_type:complete
MGSILVAIISVKESIVHHQNYLNSLDFPIENLIFQLNY